MVGCVRRIAISLALSFTVLPVSAQFYKLHNADVAVGGTGQFTTSITSQVFLNHQSTTQSAGFLLSMRDHPVSFAGVELNYQYSSFSERFYGTNSFQLAKVPIAFHEATAAYLVHPHFRHLQPFVGLGGGATFFVPSNGIPYQLRGTGLAEFGMDLPTSNPHLGFRLQGRALFYRAPNFRNAALASSRWVATEEPSASVYLRF